METASTPHRWQPSARHPPPSIHSMHTPPPVHPPLPPPSSLQTPHHHHRDQGSVAADTTAKMNLPTTGVATAAGRGGGCLSVGVEDTPSVLSCVAGRMCTGPMQLPQLTRGTLGGRQVSGSGAGSGTGGAGEARRETFASLHEWLGAVSCGIGGS
ncbi:MAG: hypothetical protein WDW38_000694 [Sanguina aurantia]